MTTKVTSVAPVIKNGVHDSYQEYFKFWYVLENGMAGEVMHKSQTARFAVGDQVEATDSTNPKYPDYPKLKLQKPGEQGGGGYGGKKSGGWSPEKEASIRLQGFIKNAVLSGAKTEAEIEALVMEQGKVYAKLMKKVKEAHAAPAAQPQAQAQPIAQPPPQAAAAAPPAQPGPQEPIRGNDEDDLPF